MKLLNVRSLVDIEGNVVEIGDIIIRPIYGTLAKCQVIGIYNKHVKVSVHREIRWKKATTTYNRNDFDTHNSTVVLDRCDYRGYDSLDILLSEKKQLTSEDLKKYSEVKVHDKKKT